MQETGEKLLDRLLAVRPSRRQTIWQEMEYYNFIHFNLNTFYGKEWGTGRLSPKKFRPRKLNTDQWAEALHASGSKGVILTVKHHDGFCLYPSRYTEYSIKHTPFQNGHGDIVRDLAASCLKYGLKLGIYLSPWDMHAPTYASPAYNDYFANQLTELMTQYGKIFSVWFDGACGVQEAKKRQLYDFPRFYEIIRKHQPEAVISICGPDVRWIGNEGGQTRPAEWSVVPACLCDYETVSALSQQSDDARFMNKPMLGTVEDLGSRERLKNEPILCWYPAEVDVSITRKGWFWHKGCELFYTRTAEELLQLYYSAVGHNASFLLNVPVNRKGLIPNKFVKCLRAFGRLREAAFRYPVPPDEKKETACGITLTFQKQHLTKAVIGEDLQFSQRVEAYRLTTVQDGREILLKEGQTIGYKEICLLDVDTDNLTLTVTACRREPHIQTFTAYA